MNKKPCLIRLREPELCLECPFIEPADVVTTQGEVLKTVFCKRLDCDNWDRESAEPLPNFARAGDPGS